MTNGRRNQRRFAGWKVVIEFVWVALALGTIGFAEVGLASIGAAEWGGYVSLFVLVLAGFTAHVHRRLRDYERYFGDGQ